MAVTPGRGLPVLSIRVRRVPGLALRGHPRFYGEQDSRDSRDVVLVEPVSDGAHWAPAGVWLRHRLSTVTPYRAARAIRTWPGGPTWPVS